jgi:hypothetical protein
LVVKTQENIISLSRKEKHQEIDNWEQTHWTGWWIHNAEARKMEVSDGNGVKRQRWEDFGVWSVRRLVTGSGRTRKARFFSNSKGGFVSYVKLGRTWPRFDMFDPINIDLELGFFWRNRACSPSNGKSKPRSTVTFFSRDIFKYYCITIYCCSMYKLKVVILYSVTLDLNGDLKKKTIWYFNFF